ncbi:MAG: hypothetical protein ACKVT0_01610 [Planctomycetaceae bacterium]
MNCRSIEKIIVWGIIGVTTWAAPAMSYADGWFFTSSEERHAKRQRAWEEKASLPVGARQRHKYGKDWPPKPRPTERQQPLIHRYHNAHYWPLPYVCDDRAYVRNLTELQVASGWVTATTLYDYHFDKTSQELNRAGEIQLRWILENTPVQYRFTFVQNAGDALVNQRRVDSVQMQTGLMLGAEQAPPVMLRVTSPLSRPASEVVHIQRADMESMPAPRIQYEYTSGGSGSGE